MRKKLDELRQEASKKAYLEQIAEERKTERTCESCGGERVIKADIYLSSGCSCDGDTLIIKQCKKCKEISVKFNDEDENERKI